ncbi:MAG: acyltransferase [Acidobacteriota bacterium]
MATSITQPAAPIADARAHIPSLDGLRGIAILFVMVHHYTIIEPASALDAAVVRYLTVGWAGVDLFFVLSGFLITGLLYDDRGAPGYFRRFYARRTLRIFPLYYLVVFLSLVVLPQCPDWYLLLVGPVDLAPVHEAAFWLYLSNVSIAMREAFQHGILGVSWSLAIEEQFYLVWAPVVWWLGRRELVALSVALIVAAPALRALLLYADVHHVAVYVATPARLDALATGALVALVVRGPAGAVLGRWSLRAAVLLLGLVVAMVSWGDNNWWDGGITQRVGYTLIALAAGATVCHLVTSGASGRLARALSGGVLGTFGKYSYALYLVHLPVMRMAREFVFDPRLAPAVGSSQLPAQALFYVVAGLPALALGWASWRWFEEPILRLKRHFPYGPSRTAG